MKQTTASSLADGQTTNECRPPQHNNSIEDEATSPRTPESAQPLQPESPASPEPPPPPPAPWTTQLALPAMWLHPTPPSQPPPPSQPSPSSQPSPPSQPSRRTSRRTRHRRQWPRRRLLRTARLHQGHARTYRAPAESNRHYVVDRITAIRETWLNFGERRREVEVWWAGYDQPTCNDFHLTAETASAELIAFELRASSSLARHHRGPSGSVSALRADSVKLSSTELE